MFDNNANVQIFGKRLAILADVLGGRAPSSPQAVEVWKDAMNGIPLSYAIAAVNRWASYHSKFPSPAEIRKVAEEDFLRDQERREMERKDRSQRLSDVRPADPAMCRALDRWRAIPRPRVPDQFWLKRNLVRWVDGEKTSAFGEKTLRELFGDPPRADVVEAARSEVEAYERAMVSMPLPSQLVGEV